MDLNLSGTSGNDSLSGQQDNDVINGYAGNDTLSGGAGNDRIYGGSNNDILSGGAGNDYLEGNAGTDTYIFNRGDGQDVIDNGVSDDGYNISIDTLKFGAGITKADIQLGLVGKDLVLSLKNTTDKVTIENYYYNGAYIIENIEFADGSKWNTNDITNMEVITMNATDDDNTLNGQYGKDAIDGRAGNDVINGYAGNDTLSGGAGNDRIYGGSNNDILSGGAGNDYLEGNAGTDTYIFNRGDGQDVINNGVSDDGYNISIDTLKFGAGITPADILLSKSDNNLVFSLKNTTDKVTIENYYYSGAYIIENIEFADKSVYYTTNLTLIQVSPPVLGNIINGTLNNDTLVGTDQNESIFGLAGNDKIYAGAGNDILDGGAGDDTLSGNMGNDTLNGDAGYDELYGGLGADIYDFSAGIKDSEIVIDQGEALNTSIDIVKIKGVEADYIIGRQNTDLKIIEKANQNNRLTVKDFFVTGLNNQIENFAFTGASTVKTYQQILDTYYTQLPPEIFTGTANSEILTGSDGNDIIDAKAGDDIIYASNGHDEIYGNTGNDVISGNAGYDYIVGGRGNDELYGGNGGDKYLFSRDDGVDTIINADSDSSATSLDIVQFMDAISANQLWLQKVGNDLDVSVIGTGDKVRVKDWYTTNGYNANQVDAFKTQDGKSLLNANVNQLVQAMASFDPPPMGQTTLTSNYQNSLNNVIAASWI